MTNFKTHFHGNQWLVSSIAISWLLFWAFQPVICTLAVRLAEVFLLGLGINAIDDGTMLMLPYRQLSFGGACAGLGVVLGLFSAGAYFLGRPPVPALKSVAGLGVLPAAVAAQAIRIALFAM